MKDIPIKRIFRYALAVMIVLTIAAYSNPANAETGTLRIQAGTTASNYQNAYSNTGTFVEWNKILVDSNNYTGISHIYFTEATMTFVNESNSTAFSFVSGATGSGGTATYNKADKRVDWYFATDTIITGNTIELSYTTNIFTGIGCPTFVRYQTADSINSTHPAYIKHSNSATSGWVGCDSTLAVYTSDVSTTVENGYNVNYSSVADGLLSTVSITKAGQTVITKVNITNSTALKYYETSFNTNNYEYSFLYDTGIALNMTDALGNSDFVVVNSTAYTGPGAPTGANKPSDNTLNGIGIVWEFNTYTLDSIGNLSWSKTTPALACDNIKIYNPVDVLVATITNPNDMGFFKILLNNSGTWTAKYNRQTICVLSNEEVLNTAYTNVPSPEPSYLVINATTIAGKSENVTYRSGRISPFAPYIAVKDANGNVEGKFSISGYATNVEGTSPVVIISAGQHTIKICDAFGCDDAVAVTNTVFNTSIPTMNITLSNITMDNTVYSFEDTAIVKYAIDNFNFSNKAIIITSYNWDFGIEQTRQVGLNTQTGSFEEVLSLFLGRYVYTGLYSMRLVGRNETGDYILAYWNFTISDIDAEGYKLTMSKNKMCLGESNTFVVLSPATSYLNITLNTNGNVFNSYYINMNKTISYKPTSTGTYSVLLISPEGYTKRSYTFDVNACVTPTPTPGATQGAQQAKAIANMLVSNTFWSFIITAGLMIAIAWRTRHGMATVAIGALSMTVFAAVGWFPLWAFFSIVIICATLLAANWVRQQFDIGTSGD